MTCKATISISHFYPLQRMIVRWLIYLLVVGIFCLVIVLDMNASCLLVQSSTTCCSAKSPRKRYICPRRSCLSSRITKGSWCVSAIIPLFTATSLLVQMEPIVLFVSICTRHWPRRGSFSSLITWRWRKGSFLCWVRLMPSTLRDTRTSWKKTVKVMVSLGTEALLTL